MLAKWKSYTLVLIENWEISKQIDNVVSICVPL